MEREARGRRLSPLPRSASVEAQQSGAAGQTSACLAFCMRCAASVSLLRWRDAFQGSESESGTQILLGLGQRQQRFQRRLIPPIATAFSSFGIHLDLGLRARTVVIQDRDSGRRCRTAGWVRRGAVGIWPQPMCLRMTAPFLVSTSPLSLLCRGRLLVCSMSSLFSSRATVWLMNSLPLSE